MLSALFNSRKEEQELRPGETTCGTRLDLIDRVGNRGCSVRGGYEVASGEKISEAVRVATIMDHAPDAVKSMLRLSLLEQRRQIDN